MKTSYLAGDTWEFVDHEGNRGRLWMENNERYQEWRWEIINKYGNKTSKSGNYIGSKQGAVELCKADHFEYLMFPMNYKRPVFKRVKSK